MSPLTRATLPSRTTAASSYVLLRDRLTSSRESICDAMIFAFEKSNAAVHVADLLEEALLEGQSDGC